MNTNSLKILPFVTGNQLMVMNIKPLENIIDPILPVGGIGLIYSKRGLGKTFFCLELAYSVANGAEFINWSAKNKAKVLYLDAEMQLAATKERLGIIHHRRQIENGLDNIILFNNELIPNHYETMLNIDLAEHRKLITSLVESCEIDLIILDNLSSSKLSGGENDSKEFNDLLSWARKLRSKGKSIIFLHHTGKRNEGDAKTPRGSSKLEDNLDTSIILQEGNREGLINLEFTKHRHFSKEQAAPICLDFSPQTGWKILGDYKTLEEEFSEERDKKVLALKLTGKTNEEIAKEVGLKGKGTISKIVTESKFIIPELKDFITNCQNENKPREEICKLLGIKTSSFAKIMMNCFKCEIDLSVGAEESESLTSSV